MRRKAIHAIIDAIALGTRVKPVQEAIRRSISRYRLWDQGLDRRISGIVYNVYRYQGLLERIISSETGISLKDLPIRIWAALLLVTYIVVFDEKMDSSRRHSFKRVISRYVSSRIRDNELKEILLDYIRGLRRGWSPRSRDEEIMYEYLVSPQLYEALRKSFDELNEDLRAFLKYTISPPPRTFRVNTLKASVRAVEKILGDLGVEYSVGMYSGRAVRIMGGLPREVIRLVETGILVPQDESSIVAVELLDPAPGSRIADLCAAPGGKTTYLAEYTGLKTVIHSFEIYRDRARRLRLLLERTGTSPVVRIHVADARRAPEILDRGSMDYVLLDPPCSSTGAIARNPDVRWRFDRRDVENLVKLQEELLESAWSILRRGGRLLYTVCSVLTWEGEHVIRSFLEKHDDARLVSLDKPFSSSPVLEGTMRAFPHRHGVIGFYYALIEKK